MVKLGKKIVKYHIPILIISVLLLIPSVIGFVNTRVNYDILSYLPDDIDTMTGQNILMDDFHKGAFSMYIAEGMEEKDVSALKEKIENVDGVADVIWYDSIMDLSVPMDVIPSKLSEAFNSSDATMMAIFFEDTTSADKTLEAIDAIRKLSDKQCFLSGMSAVVDDIKILSEKETVMYVIIAAILTSIILAVFMNSFLLPVFFMLNIGMAIIYNLGTNIFLGDISFITQALAAVLQLAVTMDYSIFLWHSYEEQQIRFNGDKKRAMAHAISATISSVSASSLTTVAGFIALCFMAYRLGFNLGIVMAKGVVFGVIGCVTILPSMILVFDRAIEKTSHRSFIPDLGKVSGFVVNHSWIFITVFLALLVPSVYGYINTDVYYNLDTTLPQDLASIQANEELAEKFDMNATHMVLVDANMEPRDANTMLSEIDDVDGVKWALGLDSVLGPNIPREVIPESLTNALKSDKWQLILVTSEYKTASDEVNNQVDSINGIVKKYDKNGMVIGEAPCTKDLIDITDTDFKVVSAISIAAIFLIILVTFKSISVPILLVIVIEFAIFINMGIPCYTNTVLPFIASIVIGTIQLGATVDYAILMTNRYRRERRLGKEKKEAVTIALSTSIKSIIVSALGFFMATIGVGIYSSIDMIGSLCNLMARGAIISMFVVICLLPSFLMIFDKIILKTSIGFKPDAEMQAKQPDNKFISNEKINITINK